jgi:hypothetical protein
MVKREGVLSSMKMFAPTRDRRSASGSLHKYILYMLSPTGLDSRPSYTDNKENKIFLIYKEIHMG